MDRCFVGVREPMRVSERYGPAAPALEKLVRIRPPDVTDTFNLGRSLSLVGCEYRVFGLVPATIAVHPYHVFFRHLCFRGPIG